MNLKGIFEAITPPNIKDIPLIQTAMEIFIEHLEKNAGISENISNLYETKYKASDNVELKDEFGNVIGESTALKEAKVNVRKGLLDVYLNALYQVLQESQTNPVVQARIQEMISRGDTENPPLMESIDAVLNNEYFITNKPYKERVGTETSINYAYNLAKYLYGADHSNDMVLEEIKSFHFKTEGTVIKELYENVVKPLSHPIGFTYNYTQIIKETLTDLFGVQYKPVFKDIELRNTDGRFHVFTDSPNIDLIKQRFYSRFNPITNTFFTELDFNQQVTVYTNKNVSYFIDDTIDGRLTRKFWFSDGVYLEQKNSPNEISIVHYIGEPGPESFLYNTQLYDYSGNWSLYLDYSTSFDFTFSEQFSTLETDTFSADSFVVTDPLTAFDSFQAIVLNTLGFYMVSEDGANDYYFTTTDESFTDSTTTVNGAHVIDVVTINVVDGTVFNIGDSISFSNTTGSQVYNIIGTTATTITLDTGLASALVGGEIIYLYSNYYITFEPNP